VKPKTDSDYALGCIVCHGVVIWGEDLLEYSAFRHLWSENTPCLWTKAKSLMT